MLRPCKQTKCSFNTMGQLPIMCPDCASCKTEQHIINDVCDKCWNCENDDGILRNGKTEKEMQEAAKQLSNKIDNMIDDIVYNDEPETIILIGEIKKD